MDRPVGLKDLPLTLAIALRLRGAGASDALIATALDIEPEGVEPLLGVAEAKLRRMTEKQRQDE